MTTIPPAQPQQVLPYSPGTGRRKCAVAQVKLIPGTGKITINDRAVKDYFPREAHELLVTQPLRTTNVLNKYNVVVKVEGGGPSGQAGAVCHGIARALQRANPRVQGPAAQGRISYPRPAHEGTEEAGPGSRSPGEAVHEAIAAGGGRAGSRAVTWHAKRPEDSLGLFFAGAVSRVRSR